MGSKLQVSVEVTSPERHSFSVRLLSSVITSKNDCGLNFNPENPSLVICLIYEEDLIGLRRVFEKYPLLPVVICVKSHGNKLLKIIDGWIYGCKIPKRVPTPMVIDATSHSASLWDDIFKTIKRTYGKR